MTQLKTNTFSYLFVILLVIYSGRLSSNQKRGAVVVIVVPTRVTRFHRRHGTPRRLIPRNSEFSFGLHLMLVNDSSFTISLQNMLHGSVLVESHCFHGRADPWLGGVVVSRVAVLVNGRYLVFSGHFSRLEKMFGKSPSLFFQILSKLITFFTFFHAFFHFFHFFFTFSPIFPIIRSRLHGPI